MEAPVILARNRFGTSPPVHPDMRSQPDVLDDRRQLHRPLLPPVGLSTVGGNAVNVAVHLARLGRAVAYLGAVGAGRRMARASLAALRAEPVEARVEVAPASRPPSRTWSCGRPMTAASSSRSSAPAPRTAQARADHRRTCGVRPPPYRLARRSRRPQAPPRRLRRSSSPRTSPSTADPAGIAVAFASAGESGTRPRRNGSSRMLGARASRWPS